MINTTTAPTGGSEADVPPQTNPTIPNNNGLPPHRKKMWMWIALVALIVIIIGAVSAYFLMQKNTGPTANRKVKIGLIGPFTGDAANYGEVMKHGAEMAQRDYNKEGLTIELIERDTSCDAKKAEAAAKDLVNQGVVAIIGEVCSGATLAALPVANQHKVVLLSPSSSSPELTKENDFFFRTYPTDTHQAIVTTELMQKRNIKKIAVMHSDEAYGSALAKVTVDNFQKLGGTITANEAFNTKDTDFKTKLAQIKATNPEALYITTNGVTAGAAIVVQARQAGLTMPIYAADALKDSSFLADVGSTGDGMTLITVTPGNRAFLDEYKARYGTEPANATGAQSYDGFMALARAIAGGANTGEEIRQALPKISFTGMSGDIKFDKYGDLDGGGYLIYTIKDGQFVLSE